MKRVSMVLFSSIMLLMLSWALFMLLPIDFTMLILLPFYISIYLLGEYFKKEKNVVFFGIGFALIFLNFLLDYLIYDTIHSVNLDAFYYLSINLLHGSLFFLPRIKLLAIYFISVTLFIISFILWVVQFPCYIMFIFAISILIQIASESKKYVSNRFFRQEINDFTIE